MDWRSTGETFASKWSSGLGGFRGASSELTRGSVVVTRNCSAQSAGRHR